ncbi:MAG: hypothetical protein IKF91_03890 [Bacilli bacterium]|nr:hypothetical protein [Bacilli bacterium]
MSKKKEKRLTSIVILGLFIAMIAVIAVSGTYAKYTTKFEGTDTATIAKWDVSVTGISSSSIDLFKTIKDTGGTNNETDVAAAKMIAPGTSGSFNIVLTNQSDVPAKYTVSFEETNPLGAKIVYSVNGTDCASLAACGIDETAVAMTNGSATIPVAWRWEYDDDNDTQDTTVGVNAKTAADKTVTVKATLNVTQVD